MSLGLPKWLDPFEIDVALFANRSPSNGTIEEFDKLDTYTIEKDRFRSHNADPMFDLNAVYFRYSKPYRAAITFVSNPTTNRQKEEPEIVVVSFADVLRWSPLPNHLVYEMKPAPIIGDTKTYAFRFYANPYYLGLGVGFFEPRIYKQAHNVGKVVISKELELKDCEKTRYALFLARRAKDMLDFSIQAFYAKDYGLCLHFSRLSMELALKTIFPAFGQRFEWGHDPSKLFNHGFRDTIHRKAPDFPLERLLWLSQHHVRPDRSDFYGDSVSYAPADLVVKSREAWTATNDAELAYQECTRLMEIILRK
jgi:HEPN domain-containing protein